MRLKTINVKVSAVIGIIFILFICSSIYPNTRAQTTTSFSPTDQFRIPFNNGIVNFAVNGSYSQATLENDSWAFQNLSIKGSSLLPNFLVSAQNSNITIFSFFSSDNSTTTLRLGYVVEGSGKQVFNFGQGAGQLNGLDWTVARTVNGKTIFLTPGVDWTISTNGTVVVNGSPGNFSIFRFGNLFSGLPNSNLPFYEQHSVAIATSAVVAGVVGLAIVLAVRNNKFLTGKKAGDNDSIFGKSSTLKSTEKP